MAAGACATEDYETFFPKPGQRNHVREAKGICSGCSIRAECLEGALERGERFGIWGGLTERERMRLRGQRRQAALLSEPG